MPLVQEMEFPSLKGFDLAIDSRKETPNGGLGKKFPSLKGFDLAIDICIASVV